MLSRILESRGDRQGASTERELARAAGLGQEALRLRTLDLTERAIGKLDEALRLNPANGWLHANAATCLLDCGHIAEAQPHVRGAVEALAREMPLADTAGGGCEELFRNAGARTSALALLVDLVRRQPENARAHFLLGFARESEGLGATALVEYRAAVSREPDFLAAWRGISRLRLLTTVPVQDREAAALACIRLDPLSRHAELLEPGTGGWNGLTPWAAAVASTPDPGTGDLAALWSACETAQALRGKPAEKLYPLRASAAMLDRAEETQPGLAARMRWMGRFGWGAANVTGGDVSPGTVLATQTLVSSIASLLDQERQGQGGVRGIRTQFGNVPF